MTPHLDPAHLTRSFAPLAQHLSSVLGVKVEVSVASSYDELGALLGRGEVDIGAFSPFAYVRAAKVFPGLSPVASVIADGSATAAGYIVVRRGGPLKDLESLRAKSIAFVDPASTTGYLYPLKLFRDRGLDPLSYFSQRLFLGNHQAVLLAVHEGRADAGAIYHGALSALHRAKGIDPNSFRIVAKTARSPRDLWCARAGLDPALVAKLQGALLSLSSISAPGREVLSPLNINGFFPPDEQMFEAIRAADAELTDAGWR
jgi:phosphonate transport system substrate-binding protein